MNPLPSNSERHAQPGPAPSGIIRTTGVVATGQPRAWGRTMARPTSSNVAGLIGGMGGAFAGLAGFQWLAHDGSGGSVLVALLAGAVLGAVLTVIITAAKFAVTPAKFAREMPVGAPMEAEFGAERIAVRIGDYQRSAELGARTAMALRDDLLVISTGDKKAPVVVPRQLVPPQVVERYLK
ncbi:hypothetical protein H7J77_07400 [Mycolicibacillus parakoreensis]|uniref:DUF3093 domain-containing protein n=1 Tax=Mycolicibacillus parakoreensis TaxID=1069221 RepID=A0ABY3TZX7_9MYCO|nr:hypothetical protein [Mycolicibacillus parakoreensis]MCV7315361.1 hypothetical protein [Mycolicibacillus parakoreensis]ULN52168.1 hypothetical protein MIU77_15100 [Mycolicibacillus parakoreensis]